MEIKRFYAKTTPVQVTLLTFFFSLFGTWDVMSQGGGNQPIQFCGTYHAIPPNGSNPDSIIVDRFGNSFDLADLALPAQPLGVGGVCAQAGYFSPTYYGNVPAAAFPVICQVLTNVSSIIPQRQGGSDCGALGSKGVALQIAWLNFNNPDPVIVQELGLDLPLPGIAAGIGSPFYSLPQDLVCNEVLLDRPFIAINGGHPYPSGEFDGRILINSAFAWNFNNNLPTGGFPGLVDFHSVLLHEMMHVMGYASRMGFADAYSLWDQSLRVVNNYQPGGGGANPQRAIVNPSGCMSNCWQRIPDLANIIQNSCSNALPGPDVVLGDAAIAPIQGGDPSHLSPTCSGQNVNYVMQSGLASNVARRFMTDEEQRIFCEMGYQVQSPTVTCNGCYNIAHQDIGYAGSASCCSKIFYGCAGETIEVLNDELLCNDATNAPPQTVTRVWTFPIHPAPVPNATGTGWLIQIPINTSTLLYNYTVTGCDCRQHNALFRIIIDKQCPPCTFSPDPCDNLLCVSDFENFTNTTSMEVQFGWPVFFQGAPSVGTPDIKVTNLGNHYLYMGNPASREVVNLELQKCIEPGCSLTMSMDLSISGGFPKHLEVWGSTGRPCDVTVPGFNPIANSCTQATECNPAYTFEPICIFDDEFLVSNQWVDNNNPNLAHYGPHTWQNLTDQNVCYLTFVPTGIGAIYMDNVSATVICEPEILCVETTDEEVCQGTITEIKFQVCAIDLPDCLDQTLVTPTVVLPSGWTLVSGNLGSFPLADNQCKTISIQVLVAASAPLGNTEIMFSGTATGLCTTVEWSCSANVTLVFCPPSSDFTCPCLSSGLNIDASINSPFYDPILGGTPFAALEAAFNFDLNNNGYIDLAEHNGCIAIMGRLIIDQNLGIAECQNVKMQPCSEIVVGTNTIHSSLDLSGTTLYGCNIMWRGITVTPHAELKYKLASFSDAQFAVTVIGSSSQQQAFLPTRFYSRGGIFVRNHIGVYIPTSWIENVWHAPFINNKFIGSEQGKTLLPPCDANLPNYSDQMGYAGLVTLGTSFDVGTPGQGGYVNTFQGIRNGVIGENSAWVNVNRARFDNLPGYMGINGNPSFGASSGVGVLVQGGFSAVRNSRFVGVGHGVYANHPFVITAEKNQMLDVYTGIQTTRPANFGFKENIPIWFRDFGIHAVNPTAFHPFGGFAIDGNNLNTIVADNNGIVEAGIYVFDSHNLGNNEGSRITDNQISLRNTVDGISIVSVDNWLLDGNKVDFNAHLGNEPHTTNGIGLASSSHNELYGNTVTNNSTNVFNTDFGIQTSNSPANTFCCNTTKFTDRGLYFTGTCDNTLLRYQSTDSHIFSTLECTAGTVISPQPDLFNFPDDNHSNEFHVGSVAMHEGDLTQIQNSEFNVKTNVPLDHPEIVFLPNIPGGYDPLNPKWFLVSGNDNNDCNTAGGCPPPPPPYGGEPPIRDSYLSETDGYFASGGFYGSPYGAALQWEGGLRLYKRMQQYPELMGQSVTVDAFYANAETNAVGAYAAVDGAIASINALPPQWTSAMQSAQISIQNAVASAESQLAALASVSTWEDSAAIYRAAEQTRLIALPAYQNLMQYVHLADSLRNVKAQAAWVLNQALSATNNLQSNRKTVNRVYLETIGQGIMSLTTTQFAAIAPIAWQCPLEGGNAVYTARGLYQLHTAAYFDDRSLCGLGSQERGVQRANAVSYEALKVQPNPAFGDVLVTLPTNFVRDEVWLEISDIDGRVVFSKPAPEDINTLLIDISNLPVGLYILSAIGNSKPLAPVKFVVQH